MYEVDDLDHVVEAHDVPAPDIDTPTPLGSAIDALALLRAGNRRFVGKLALNGFVIESGEIAVGDEVQLVRGRACAKSAAFIE